jgi:probable F420-dependent oxidoreductase
VGDRPEAKHFTTTPELRDFVVHAEGLGFDAFWMPDHVVMPRSYSSRYPYQSYAPGETFRRYPFDDVPFPEPFTALAFVAGATERIRLSTGVLILPERNPVLFAKQAATLDGLSAGRLQLGIGIGWLREEFEALGLPWADRGRRTDECIEAIRLLWRSEVASYHGRHVSFDDIMCDPKPSQLGGVPLIVGGHTPAAARRAGRLGDGFIPTGAFDDPEVAQLVAIMREAAGQAGRDPSEIKLYSGGGADPKAIEAMAVQGVSGVYIASFPTDLDSGRRWLDDLSTSVLGVVR